MSYFVCKSEQKEDTKDIIDAIGIDAIGIDAISIDAKATKDPIETIETIETIDAKDNIINEILKKLNDKTDKNVPYFSFNGKTFIAKHCNIYDGDTFSVIFEYNNEIIKYRCRCMGYDCAEMKPSKMNENRIQEKELALLAKKRLEQLLNKHSSKLIKIECLDFDKYGRLLVNVWNMVDSKSINEIMIEEGHGKAYMGGKKEAW
jgi:endonuclease YncB( thermonuclease family)